MTNRLRIIVSGMISADPGQGGAAWAVLQYVIGLRELGHDVCLIEPIVPAALRPKAVALSASDNARYFNDVIVRFGLTAHAALLCQANGETVGLSYIQLRERAAQCDVLINVSGMLTEPALLERIDHRVYLDLDPAFNQLWQASEQIDMRFDGHTHFVTVGQAIGQPGSPVPSCDRSWIPTVPPVVLSQWPNVALPSDHRGWTTVANWRAYGSILHRGMLYGQKAHSLRRLIQLPQVVNGPLELALAIDPGETNDIELLRTNGWRWVDPACHTATPDSYQAFIHHSKGEFGVAKSGYVIARCGWFSDRSACYLASGRPVVAQDTGFSAYLPTGEGLLAFDDMDGAAGAMERVEENYALHARRAREVAQDCLRSDHVLGRLLDRIALPSASHPPAGASA